MYSSNPLIFIFPMAPLNHFNILEYITFLSHALMNTLDSLLRAGSAFLPSDVCILVDAKSAALRKQLVPMVTSMLQTNHVPCGTIEQQMVATHPMIAVDDARNSQSGEWPIVLDCSPDRGANYLSMSRARTCYIMFTSHDTRRNITSYGVKQSLHFYYQLLNGVAVRV